ncbi:MAG: ATP-binding cassette domain-containing protein [Desulfobacterales bacterium]|jgi:ABC-2 type transport system ATP-binding protein
MIEVKQLTKLFGTRKAVDAVSFTVNKGEILGFMGPNGAGKSTTMRMLTGYLSPSSGTAVVGGCDIVENPLAAQKKMGYLPENAPVYREMTVSGFLDFISEIRGFAGHEKRNTVAAIIERCFLAEVRSQPIGTLSKGYKQRVCFAQSILHDPEYLILDEPTDGLDPNQKHEVRQMIREMSAQKGIILSTHILDEVDAVCTRVIIIDRGKVVADDTPDGLRARSSYHGAVSVAFEGDWPEKLVEVLGGMAEVGDLQVVGETGARRLRIFPKHPGQPIAEAVLSTAVQNGASVASFYVEQGRLDEVFRSITTGAEASASADSI